MSEKYWVIVPCGDVNQVTIDRAQLLDRMHEVIGCDCLEQVRTIIPGLCMIVDESGKIKTPPQEFNPVASMLYWGWLRGNDPIVGPAILVSLQPVPPLDEMDWFPITPFHELQLKLLFGEDFFV